MRNPFVDQPDQLYPAEARSASKVHSPHGAFGWPAQCEVQAACFGLVPHWRKA